MKCKHCGCTDEHACKGGCFWMKPEFCSRCYLKCYLKIDAEKKLKGGKKKQ